MSYTNIFLSLEILTTLTLCLLCAKYFSKGCAYIYSCNPTTDLKGEHNNYFYCADEKQMVAQEIQVIYSK